MANANFNEEETINVNLQQLETANVNLPPINYIPGYKEAEEQRRANEVVRQENETERIALYEDIEQKLESGYFNGDDGYSPTANVSKTGNTSTITITDKIGTTTAEVKDGIDGQDGTNGQDGKDGVDGYSPTASVSKSGKVATITITDKNGTTTATISDGEDGSTAEWGNITGTLSNQSDLYTALGNKANISDLNNKVSNTDYATTNTAGVVKQGYRFKVNENGQAYAETLSYANYLSYGNNSFIGKGTLENVFAGKGFTTKDDYLGNIRVDSVSSKNLLDISCVTNSSDSSMTLTNNGDGSVTFDGTASANVNFTFELTTPITLKAGLTYTYSLNSSNKPNHNNANVNLRDDSNTMVVSLGVSQDSTTYTPASDTLIKYIRFYIVKNGVLDDFITFPQLEIGGTPTRWSIFKDYDFNNKQDKLVSGTNIKTINNTSVLGSGDIRTHFVSLIAVDDTAPAECTTGNKYFNTTTNLIYTATATDTWSSTGESPIEGIFYIVFEEQTTYAYNGTTLVSVGGGSGGGGDNEPIGKVVPMALETAPDGYLLCDGSTYTKAAYPDLYKALRGTQFIVDTNSFNVPNIKGKVIVGKDSTDTEFDTLGETGGSKELQAHSHKLYGTPNEGSIQGEGYIASAVGNNAFNSTANTTTTGTGNSGNLQPYIVLNYFIKAQKTNGDVVLSEDIKIGTIFQWSGDTAPTNYMICDGSAISRTNYADLFSIIGTTYGSGDGSTTFNLPNLKGRVPVGLDSSQTEFDTLGYKGGSKYLQEHTHGIPSISANAGFQAGNDYNLLGTQNSGNVSSGVQTGNSGNLQPYQVVNYIIKVSGTTQLSAQVVNTYNTSDSDTYSCNYVNGINGKVLWTNSNPASISTSSLVVDDMSDYDVLEVVFRQHINDTSKLAINRFVKSVNGGVLQYCEVGSGFWVIRTREYEITDNTHISIKQGYENNSGSVNSNNLICIPIYVVGYKTGLFN